MNRLQTVLGALCWLTCIGQPVLAQDTNTDAESQTIESSSSRLDAVKDWFKADIYRVSYGGGSLQLKNPDGFDVESVVYDDGFSRTGLFEPGSLAWSVSGERAIGWEGRQKRVWDVHYDSDDYGGLKLQTLMFGTGVALDPSQAFSIGGRIAAGVGVGLTRSQTYFDRAVHPAAEVWVSVGGQVGRFVIDLSLRERQALGASLDERNAAPRTSTRMISLGWLF